MKVLVVLTNVSKYKSDNKPTGVWLSEATHFVDVLEKNKFDIVFASPAGGYIPIDPNSFGMADEIDWSYYTNPKFMAKLGNTLPLDQVEPSEYAAIYFAGGHGTMWDFRGNKSAAQIVKHIYENGGYVSAVCHGLAGLLDIPLSSGQNILEGKTVTGFSNGEESALQLEKFLPYFLEDELKKQSKEYRKANKPQEPLVVEDGRLITGQNPASTKELAELLATRLSAK